MKNLASSLFLQETFEPSKGKRFAGSRKTNKYAVFSATMGRK